MKSLLLFITHYSYPGIFLALGLGILGLPIPDELLMSFVGFLIYRGELGFASALIVAFAGTCCGITVGYLLGRLLGHPLLESMQAGFVSIPTVSAALKNSTNATAASPSPSATSFRASGTWRRSSQEPR